MKLTQEQLTLFLAPFRRVPLMSGVDGVDGSSAIEIQIAVRLAPQGYYEIRLFPQLSDASVVAMKSKLVDQIAELTAAGRMDEVGMLPSIEDTQKRPAHEFNPFPIWRIERLFEVASQSEGYVLRAARFMPDPILNAPCLMLSYEKPEALGIDVFLLTTPLSPRINSLLSHVQKLAEDEAAARRVSELDVTEGGVAVPKIIVPGE